MIIVDTREQKPLWNPEASGVLQIKLDEGDYTTTDLIGFAHIERKSGNDLYGSMIQGHVRFREELRRALEKKIKLAIFVECPKEVFVNKRFRGGFRLKAEPKQLRKMITTISDRYYVDFVWCLGREHMREEAEKWFENQRRLKNAQTSSN